MDDLLIVTDPYNSPHVRVIDKTSGRLVRAFGKTGEGPGEYKSPLAVVGDAARHRAWIGDSPLGRVTEVSLARIDSDEWQPYTRIIRLSEKTFGDIALAAGPDASRPQFIAADMTGEARAFEIDERGRITALIGPAAPESEAVPQQIAGRVFGDVIALGRSDSVIAAGGIWTGKLVFYGRNGTRLDSAKTPINFAPSWTASGTPERPGMRATKATRKGYIDLVATEDRLVGLFSGRRMLERPGEASAGRDLHVYDWDGELLDVFRLDRDVTSIAADSEDGTMYGTQWGMRPAILRFELPGR